MTEEFIEICKALSDGHRLQAVKMLSERGSLYAYQLLEDMKITQPTLSHHMKTLVYSGLVSSEKEGRWIRYSIDGEVAERFKKEVDGLF